MALAISFTTNTYSFTAAFSRVSVSTDVNISLSLSACANITLCHTHNGMIRLYFKVEYINIEAHTHTHIPALAVDPLLEVSDHAASWRSTHLLRRNHRHREQYSQGWPCHSRIHPPLAAILHRDGRPPIASARTSSLFAGAGPSRG